MRSTVGYKAVGLLTGLLAIGASRTALAGVPSTVTQQGLLLDANNQPVTGSQNFTFTIYDAPTGGNVLWTETQTIALDGGYFSTQLGSVTTTPQLSSIFNGSTLYLGIKVGSDPEMTPREAVTSVPYAMVSRDATGDINPTASPSMGRRSSMGPGTGSGRRRGSRGRAGRRERRGRPAQPGPRARRGRMARRGRPARPALQGRTA